MSFVTTARRVFLFVAALLAFGSCSGASPSPAGRPDATAGGSAAATLPTSPAAASTSAPVLVYFLEDASVDCVARRAVERTVDARTPAAALSALLAGPTSDELARGYSSWFSAATADALVAVAVTDGTARVSFRDLRPIIPNASSSCGSEALLSALDATLLQFPAIRSTRYSFLGDEVAFYEWLQREPPPGG